MKKILKESLLLLIISLFTFILLPCTINAQNKELDYKTIYEKTNIELEENLTITSLEFKNNADNSSLSYGITALIYNSSSSNYQIDSTVYYYNKSYELLSTSSNTQEVPSNKYVDLLQMSNIDNIKNGYSVNDIYYYKIVLDYNIDSLSNKYPNSTNTPSLNKLYSSYEYVIDGYDIKINVNENNTFDITETIIANFNKPKHGIFRKIPLTNNVIRLDGTTTQNTAYIKNIKVNDKYSESIETQNKVLTIGDPNKTITGKKTYLISYNYNIGRDPNKNYDELYLNLIGPEWDTVIGNITFTINMPKDFDSSKIGFSSGPKGSIANNNIKYTVSDNIITGRYNRILNAREALTIRIELEEGYFINAGYQINIFTYLLFLIPIACLVIAFIIWYKYGKDDKVVETVEFYPPDGLNSVDIAYLYKGEVTSQDVTSLLIYLANKGYIKIVDKTSKSNSNKEFSIIKLKDYDGEDDREKLFLEGLFKRKLSKKSLSEFTTNSNSKELKESSNIEITEKDLYNSFYKTVNEILKITNSKTNRNKILNPNSLNKKKYLISLIAISLITIVTIPTLEFLSIKELAIELFCIAFFIPFLIVGLSKGLPLIFKIIWLSLILIALVGISFSSSFITIIKSEKILLIAFLVGICCIVGIILLIKFMPKRTKYGNEMLGKIRGFKKFLETAEKQKLETMVMESPTYFYDILPFTYVLGISNKWIKKFETISLKAPDWYEGYNSFDPITFGSFMDKTMASANNAMNSSPSSSSSGGSSSSSGGGSSGGGSGGGGGGSW